MSKSISNSEDVIDSRDVIERIEELQGVLEPLIDAVENAIEARDENEDDEQDEALTEAITEAVAELGEWLGYEFDGRTASEAIVKAKSDGLIALKDYGESEDAHELFALMSLAEEAEGYASDWKYGETLIRESCFEDYARELAEDTCPFPSGSREMKALEMWPYRCIDWEQAARELKMDYTTVDFDGVDYYIRSC